MFSLGWLLGAVLARGFAAASLPYMPKGRQDGDGQHGGQRPVYQRHASDWRSNDRDRRRDGFDRSRMTPQVSSGWFQRPYPYHLDYYKMRYGGSYAPYFGNLYGTPFGTPQVVYGNWGQGLGAGGRKAFRTARAFTADSRMDFREFRTRTQ